jgi:hypothetical protein
MRSWLIATIGAAIRAALFKTAYREFVAGPLKRARIPLILRVLRASARRVAAGAKSAGIGFAGGSTQERRRRKKRYESRQKSGADYT